MHPDMADEMMREIFEPVLREELRLMEEYVPSVDLNGWVDCTDCGRLLRSIPAAADEASGAGADSGRIRLPCGVVACAADGDRRVGVGQLDAWREWIAADAHFEAIMLPPSPSQPSWSSPHRYILDGSEAFRALLGIKSAEVMLRLQSAGDGRFVGGVWLPTLPDSIKARLRDLRARLRTHSLTRTCDHPEKSANVASSFRGPNKYCNWLLLDRVLIGCFPCREVWRREGADALRGALIHLVDAHRVTYFVCLEDSDSELVDGPPTARCPRYVSQLLPADWSGAASVFATTDGSGFAWHTLCACLEAICDHLVHSEACSDHSTKSDDDACAGPKSADTAPSTSCQHAAGACYVHCFGGHGRAGVVAACLLGLLFGLGGAEAMDCTQARHDARDDPAWPCDTRQPSPQTAVQRAQVDELLAACQ